jgi:predicted permease
MQLLKEIKRRIATWLHRDRFDQEMQDEMNLHLQLREEEHVDRGLTADNAHSAAHRRFGNATRIQEKSREAWGWTWLEQFLQDVHYGLRTMRRNPGFTAVAVIALALGIGANTAVFSVVNAVLLRPLAYANSDRLAVILRLGIDPVSPANFLDWQKENHVFSRMAAAEYFEPNLSDQSAPERVVGLHITHDMLPLLGVQPLLGRMFLEEEDKPGKEHEIILSYGLWQRRFSGDAGIVGKTVNLDGVPHTVVGVMPGEFKFAPFWATKSQFWAPLSLKPRTDDRGGNSLRVFVRLRDGVSLEQARAEMTAITARMEQQYPGTNRDMEVVSLKEKVIGNVRPALLVLLGAVGFVLLIACANVAHMLLARSAARQKEIAVRSALGARRGRMLRQFLTESLLLALFGATAGLLVAFAGIRLLVALGPSDIPRVETVGFDFRVLLFVLFASVITGVVFGLAPAWQASRAALNDALKDSARGSSEGILRNRLRSVLVASEFALALVLLIGAGLMVRSLTALLAINPGFDPHHVLTMIVSVAGTREADTDRRAAFFHEVIEKTSALPGMDSVSATNHIPLAGDLWVLGFYAEGTPLPKPGESASAAYRVVYPGYFKTMRIPFVHGRDVTESDNLSAPNVVIVNEFMAQQQWPGEDPLGKRLTLGGLQSPSWKTVVGVVKNEVRDHWADPPTAQMFIPYLQSRDLLSGQQTYFEYLTLVMRCSGDPAAQTASVTGVVHSLDRNVAVAEVQTMDDVVFNSNSQPRFYALLLTGFAITALVLAGIGIYGVMSYMVSRRTQEIGIRMTLGARRGAVLRMVIRQGMALVLVGAAAGLAGAVILSRLMSSLLYGVGSNDPATFIVVTAVLIVVALAANYVPARRATKIDPMAALRSE